MTKPIHTIAVVAPIAIAACYGDMVSTQEVAGFEGTPIDPTLELPCADAAEAPGDGHHYPGNSCLGCHDGALGPAFTAAGTLFADAEGAMPLSGVHVQLIDAAGASIDMVAEANGNFHTTAAVTFPATVYVSSCPDVVPMPIQLTLGDCNSCHSPGKRTAFSP